VIPTAAHAPNQNVFIERWNRSIKYECLNLFIVFGQKHFDFLISSCFDYYNTAPAPSRHWQPATF